MLQCDIKRTPQDRDTPVKHAPPIAEYPPLRLAWALWSLGAALYLIGFFHRVAPGVLGPELSRDFALDAAALGNLSAFYFYSYVAMQIPTGLLADRYGPRRLLTAGAVCAAVGSLLFALAPTLWLAGLGRLLIGGAVAVAFVSMLKFSGHWFSPRHYALSAGVALFVGVLGAVGAGVPLRLGIDAFGWRAVMLASGVLTLAVALAIWLWLRDDPSERGYASYSPKPAAADGDGSVSALAGLGGVFRYRNSWLLAIAPGGVVGCVTTFAGLWGPPFLIQQYAMSATSAAALCSAVLICWALGGPIFGALSDRLQRRRAPYLLACVVAMICWALITQLADWPQWLLVVLLLVAGFCSGCIVIGFAYARESLPAAHAGAAAGVINMGVMSGPMLLQPLVGWMLDRHWGGALVDGLRHYDFAAYRAGFAVMLGWIALSALLLALSRESRPAG